MASKVVTGVLSSETQENIIHLLIVSRWTRRRRSRNSGAVDGVVGVGAVVDVDVEEAHEEESRNQHDDYYGD